MACSVRDVWHAVFLLHGMQAVLIEHDQLALSELSAVVVSGGRRGDNLIKDYDQVAPHNCIPLGVNKHSIVYGFQHRLGACNDSLCLPCRYLGRALGSSLFVSFEWSRCTTPHQLFSRYILHVYVLHGSHST